MPEEILATAAIEVDVPTSEASDTADEALAKAEEAQTNAEDAKSTAETAQTTASEASDKADDAAKTATDYIDSSSGSVVAFADFDGIQIGAESSAHLKLDHDSIDFMDGSDVLGYVSQSKAYFPSVEAVKSVTIGNKYVTRLTPSGSLGLYLK